MFCLNCGKEIGDINENRICPFCEYEQYQELQKNFDFNKGKKHRVRESNRKNDEINQWYDMGLF